MAAVTGSELITCLQELLAADCTPEEVQAALQEVLDTDTAGTAVDNEDGTGTVTFPDGTECTFAKGPLGILTILVGGEIVGTFDPATSSEIDLPADTSGTVVDNEDGTGTVTFPDGTTCDFVKGPLVFVDGEGNAWPFDPTTNTWTIGDRYTVAVVNGDGTITVTTYNGDGSVASTATSTPAAGGDGYTTITVDADDNCVIETFDGDGNSTGSKVLEGPDGWAEQGTSIATTVDADGNPITPDLPVIDFYDADGNYVDSCLKEGSDGYNESIAVAADGTAVDSNGNPVTPPTGALPGDILSVNFDGTGASVSVCFEGTHWRVSADGCYHEEINAKGVATGVRRARHRFADPWVKSAIVPTQTLTGAAVPPAPIGLAELVREGNVAVLTNPDNCFGMNIQMSAGGRSKILINSSQDGAQWSSGAILDMQVRTSWTPGWQGVTLQQARHDIDDRVWGNRTFSGDITTTGPSGTEDTDRRAIYGNANDAGEDALQLQFNLPSVIMIGDIQHVD